MRTASLSPSAAAATRLAEIQSQRLRDSLA